MPGPAVAYRQSVHHEPASARRTGPVSVEFEDVRFGYRDGHPAAHHGVSFRIPAGGMTAFVGPSGAGKTTVFSLIERFYEPDSGRILVDGVSVLDWPLAKLRAAIGYVEQDAPVLSGTLREQKRCSVRQRRPFTGDVRTQPRPRLPAASDADIACGIRAAAVVSGLMASFNVRVARLMRTATWRALAGTEVIGEANAVLRPDRRWFVSVDTWIADSFSPLVSAVADDLRQDLYTTVDEGDEAELRNWSAAGFTVLRREHHYLIPTGPARPRQPGAALPAGMSLVSADAVDEDGLRLLDEALRQDVPGTDGWINDPQEFREYTFDGRRFDPATYLVAVDDVSQAFAGLARVWNHPRQPRLGLVGVTSGYRRRGLAKLLLAAVFAPLRDRGVSEVAAEADAANVASNALLSGIGARRVGGSIELVRRAPH